MLIEDVLTEFKRTHLEHIEDIVITDGYEGGKAVVEYFRGLLLTLKGSSSEAVKVSVKWDGAPAVVCGTNPDNGKFFVGTKSVFAKTPKICYTEEDVDLYYEGDLAEKLKFSLKYFSKLRMNGIFQGDLLFTKSTLKQETIDGELLYTFRPNTITYGIPVNHPIGQAAGRAQIGVVFHTHYRGTDFQSMQALAGADVNGSNEALVVENDTPMHRVGFSTTEMNKFNNHISKIERMCSISGDFLPNLTKENIKLNE